MCILFIYTEPIPAPQCYRLIIISNRDEFYIRPSQQISKIDNVIAGRDMENGRNGGMWLGISIQQTDNIKFRLGALLNVTDENRVHGTKGRGFIVADYLDGNIPVDVYMNSILNREEKYNGYNFVTVEAKESEITIHHCSNVSKLYTKYEKNGVYGFGNTIPDMPLKKVSAGNKRFKEVISENNKADKKEQLLESLLNLLKWNEKHLPDEELERRQPVAYEELSSVFVKMDEAGYGTRTHSIVLVDYDWNVEFFEATMKEPINIETPIWLMNTIKARL